ncbi:MAG: hypothetical protein OIF32_02990 [Campylobacterales bacterium]|nr:hypothetical protein [Campylobacterales bacterium]
MKISHQEIMDELGLKSANTISHMKKNDLDRYNLICDGLKYRKLQNKLDTPNVEMFVEKMIDSLKTLTVLVKRIKGIASLEEGLKRA